MSSLPTVVWSEPGWGSPCRAHLQRWWQRRALSDYKSCFVSNDPRGPGHSSALFALTDVARCGKNMQESMLCSALPVCLQVLALVVLAAAAGGSPKVWTGLNRMWHVYLHIIYLVLHSLQLCTLSLYLDWLGNLYKFVTNWYKLQRHVHLPLHRYQQDQRI